MDIAHLKYFLLTAHHYPSPRCLARTGNSHPNLPVSLAPSIPVIQIMVFVSRLLMLLQPVLHLAPDASCTTRTQLLRAVRHGEAESQRVVRLEDGKN